MTRLLLPLVLILSALAMPKAYADEGLVTGVHDGDSITVAGQAKNIRIRYMDAPEIKAFKWGNQPFGVEARNALATLCKGQIATLTKITKDKYDRLDANVSCQGFDVAEWQLDNGFAWPYHYNTPKKYKRMALAAKEKGLGLWALPNPVDPWAWRKQRLP